MVAGGRRFKLSFKPITQQDTAQGLEVVHSANTSLLRLVNNLVCRGRHRAGTWFQFSHINFHSTRLNMVWCCLGL